MAWIKRLKNIIPMPMWAISLGIAVATFLYYHSYPKLMTEGFSRSSVFPLFYTSFWTLFFLAFPVTIIALIIPRTRVIQVAILHAACFISFLTLMLVTDRPGHGSPGDGLGMAIFLVVCAVSGIELFLLMLAVGLRHRRGYSPPKIKEMEFFCLIIGMIIGGWLTGVAVWSITIIPTVIEAAEATAGDQPYCIEADGYHVHSKLGLNAINMYVPGRSGGELFYHGLLVMGDATNRSYKNWSYRSNRFEPVSDGVRQGLQLDNNPDRCVPILHFARNLPLIGWQ